MSVVVDFGGKRFEVMHVVDPDLAVVFLGGAVQGCAQIIDGATAQKSKGPGWIGNTAMSAATAALCVTSPRRGGPSRNGASNRTTA